jgi:hypothetical protein
MDNVVNSIFFIMLIFINYGMLCAANIHFYTFCFDLYSYEIAIPKYSELAMTKRVLPFTTHRSPFTKLLVKRAFQLLIFSQVG